MIYIAHFFSFEYHINGSRIDSTYYDSIVKMFSFFKNKPFIFLTDQKTYDIIHSKLILWDTCKIILLNLEDSATYKKYFNTFYNVIDNNYISDRLLYKTDIEKNNVVSTLIIWHFKIELFDICNKTIKEMNINVQHICYLDAGIFRPCRIQFIQDFIDNNFKIADVNDIVCNHTIEQIKNNIDFNKLIKNGVNEIALGHIIINKDIIETISNNYYQILDNLLTNNIVTTEQRVITLVIRDYYKIHPTKITFKQNKQSNYSITYTVAFHL